MPSYKKTDKHIDGLFKQNKKPATQRKPKDSDAIPASLIRDVTQIHKNKQREIGKHPAMQEEARVHAPHVYDIHRPAYEAYITEHPELKRPTGGYGEQPTTGIRRGSQDLDY